MDENNLKKFLKMNSKTPQAPTDEWSSLLSKIENPSDSSYFWKNSIFQKAFISSLSFVLLLIIVINTTGPSLNKKREQRLKEIDSFMVSDSYFGDTADQHEWISGL